MRCACFEQFPIAREAGGTSLPEVFVREGFAGMGFQVLFEIKRPLTVFERQVSHQLPWLEFRGVGRLTPIVGVEACFQIFGKPDVGLVGIRNTAQEIDVVHGNSMLRLGTLLTLDVLIYSGHMACHA